MGDQYGCYVCMCRRKEGGLLGFRDLRRAAPDLVAAEERQSAGSMQSCGNWKVCSACRYRCSLLGAGRSAYMLPTHVPAARGPSCASGPAGSSGSGRD